MSRVLPIHKKGSYDEVSNYRPISLLPILSKVLKVIKYKQLFSYFEINNFLSQSKFGFRPGRSTVQAMEFLLNVILDIMEEKGYIALMLCDFSKAFDCVSHDVLLTKLGCYGITDDDLGLIASYLRGRRQIVDVGNNHSDVGKIQCGVPQGSILGPFLFL